MRTDSDAASGSPSRRRLLSSAAAAPLLAVSAGRLRAQSSTANGAGTGGRPAGESGIRRALRERAGTMMLFDSHEHLHRESERMAQPGDVFLLFSTYVRSDLVSAGMARNAMLALDDSTIPLDVRWKSVAPYWPYASTTGYGRCTRIAARELYGVEEINAKTYATLSARVAEAGRPGLYEKVLRDKARIETAVLDDKSAMRGAPLRPEPEFFLLAARIASMSVPAENVTGLVVMDVIVNGNSVKFVAVELMMAKFDLELGRDGRMKGTLSNRQATVPIEFKRSGEANVELIPASPAVSQALEGDWEGSLEAPGRAFRMVFHFRNQTDKTVKATIDTPDSGGFGLPLDNVRQTGQKVEVGIRIAHATFEGVLNPEGTELTGLFTHGQNRTPLTLRKR